MNTNNHKKDGWDIAKILAEVSLAIAAIIFGYLINSTLKNKELQVKYVEIAAKILEDNSPIRSVEQQKLREWAGKIINKYAEIPLNNEAKKGLEEIVKEPYLEIRLANTEIPYEGKPSIVLPYFIINIGNEIAKNVQKGYLSFIIDKSGGESLIQSYTDPEARKVDLVPLQTSRIQLASLDNINISNFNTRSIDKNEFIKIELKVTYQMVDADKIKNYYTKLILELHPKKEPDGNIFFDVSQKSLNHGMANNNSLGIEQLQNS